MCGGREFLEHQGILWTPAGCPTVQLNSIYLETALDLTV